MTPRGWIVGLITLAAFVDILAYSIAVPVLPDISARLGASPTVIGLLFASFGLSVLVTSMPIGAVSDRVGRRLPLVAGLIVLAVAAVVFALADSLPWLFAARLAQGAADAVTWVVGLAVVADLYDNEERGRMMGLVMAGNSVGFLLGPTIGGSLYELGGARLPYLALAALALLTAAALAFVRLPDHLEEREPAPLGTLLRVPAVAVCSLAVIIGGGTIAMLEPVLSLHLAASLGLGPARIGLIFGVGAAVSIVFHPVFGRLADRLGGRRVTFWGLAGIGAFLPALTLPQTFSTMATIYAIGVLPITALVSPSLAYMADATTAIGGRSSGAAYGIYNFAWAVGILAGPALGGFVYEQLGFATLIWIWAAAMLAVTGLLARAGRVASPLSARAGAV
jgi:MFS transporter, DHA1 family, solute carrier family 18 (vesicular amine transporter), member 1/2